MKDMLEAGILDPYLVKHWGIKLATNAAITVLRVDQVSCYITLISHQLYSSAQNSFPEFFTTSSQYGTKTEKVLTFIFKLDK